MREILFRGKRIDNGEWVYGFYSPVNLPLVGNMGHFINEGGFRAVEIQPETVGQFTGLKDKNGKKIFEGDYWIDTDGDYLVYVVEFKDGQYGFVCYGMRGMLMPYGYDEEAGGWGEIDFTPFTDYYIDKIEVIGNIHDNPELLKGEEV